MSLLRTMCCCTIKIVGLLLIIVLGLVVGHFTTDSGAVALPLTITVTLMAGLWLMWWGWQIDHYFFFHSCPVCRRRVFAPSWHCTSCKVDRQIRFVRQSYDEPPEDDYPLSRRSRNGQASKTWFSPG